MASSDSVYSEKHYQALMAALDAAISAVRPLAYTDPVNMEQLHRDLMAATCQRSFVLSYEDEPCSITHSVETSAMRKRRIGSTKPVDNPYLDSKGQFFYPRKP